MDACEPRGFFVMRFVLSGLLFRHIAQESVSVEQ